MGKKLPSLGPNILKHLQKNSDLTRGDGFMLSLVFLLHCESSSLSCVLCAFSQCYQDEGVLLQSGAV